MAISQRKITIIAFVTLFLFIGGWFLVSATKKALHPLVFSNQPPTTEGGANPENGKESTQHSFKNTTTALVLETIDALSAVKEDAVDNDTFDANIDTALINAIKENKTMPDAYALQDITIIADSPDAIRIYANVIGKMLEDTFGNFEKGEIRILHEAGEEKDPQKLAILAAYADAYRLGEDMVKGTPVPVSYASFHLMLLNNFHNLVIINQAFANFMIDPVNTLLHAAYYNKEVERYVAFVRGVVGALEKDSISFSEQETGYVLFQYQQELANS